MTLGGAIDALRGHPWQRRSVPWIGALLIAVIVAMAAFDIVRGYRSAVDDTGRELETQARIVAEQAARSVQAIDVVLRHIASEYRRGRLARLDAEELHAYLVEQSVGLVQIDGLAMHDAHGDALAMSWLPPHTPVNVAQLPGFQKLRDDPKAGLEIGAAARSPSDGMWVIPIGRRLESPSGAFAGVIGARGRIDYFQDFYRNVRLDPGTTITLMHRDGTLLARHPPIDSALGQQFALLDRMLEARESGQPGPMRTISPVDGIERFAAVRAVPDYPLEVIVTRDVAQALAPWRAMAVGTGLRTLALALLAAALLALLIRKIERLASVHDKLDASRERFALAVAGSDDGIWDWDRKTDMVFASARARGLYGLPPGPELQTREEWFRQVQIHPEDAPLRLEAIESHMAGKTPHYEGEYRVRHPDGSWRWVRVRGLCIRNGGGEPLRMAGSVTDIDARRRAEEALRLSEERYAIAMTGSDEAHWVWDMATDELFASEKLTEVFNLPPGFSGKTRDELLAQVPFYPGDHERLNKVVDDHVAGRSPRFDIEYRIIARTGEVRWLHARGRCFRDAAGNPVRMAGSTVDVTERKRAEQALRESEERFSLAVAGANDGILDWDIANDRLFSSPRALAILGIESEVTMRSQAEWSALVMPRFHPDDVERVTNDLASRPDFHDGEYRVRAADGRYVWVRFRGMQVRDAAGHAIRWAGSVSDIDAQKRTEEALRESERRYQLAIAGVNQGVWDWDLGSDMVFMSARAQQLFGHEPGERLRPRREWLAHWTYHPDDRLRVRQAVSDYLRGLTRTFAVEYRMLHPSGQWRWYRDRGVALRDDNGRPYRMAGSIEDITDRKHAEAERDRLEGQLRQAQKLEAMGTLAGGIAHDFNNILAAILGYGEMAQKDAPEGSALRRHLDAAMSAGMRAKALVERILAFSRSGMGERVPVHVQSVVAEVLDTVAGSLPNGIELQRRLAAGDAAVFGDPTQLHQVVMNLCSNAVQAIRATGTVAVSIDTLEAAEPLRATTGELAPGHYVRLRVSDTGIGIAPQVIDRIFDPFFTTKEVGVGTGLGLSLVHGIVTDLGGGINVESELDAGSTFTVYLPWQGCARLPEHVDEPVAQGAGQTILLVDDEVPLVQLGEEMMAELGYEPIGFTSSALALESFRAEPLRFDAVLSDEAMPGMTGSELAAEIRRIRPDIPIVLMSGYATAELAARARATGVVEVLAKPLVSRDVARSLANALLQGHAARDTRTG
ncbi:MAG: PAS domain-containing protein [Gemmatimonadota bacterium]